MKIRKKTSPFGQLQNKVTFWYWTKNATYEACCTQCIIKIAYNRSVCSVLKKLTKMTMEYNNTTYHSHLDTKRAIASLLDKALKKSNITITSLIEDHIVKSRLLLRTSTRGSSNFC